MSLGPEDKSIVLDEDNQVLFSDYPRYSHTLPGDRSLLDDQEYPGQDLESLTKSRAAKEKLHLLDVLDKNPADLLRMVGSALDRPNQLIERVISFQSEQKRVRIMHIESEGEKRRTIIIIGPVK